MTEHVKSNFFLSSFAMAASPIPLTIVILKCMKSGQEKKTELMTLWHMVTEGIESVKTQVSDAQVSLGLPGHKDNRGVRIGSSAKASKRGNSSAKASSLEVVRWVMWYYTRMTNIWRDPEVRASASYQDVHQIITWGLRGRMRKLNQVGNIAFRAMGNDNQEGDSLVGVLTVTLEDDLGKPFAYDLRNETEEGGPKDTEGAKEESGESCRGRQRAKGNGNEGRGGMLQGGLNPSLELRNPSTGILGMSHNESEIMDSQWRKALTA
ncbi:hypothetical protein EDB85DRAFT_2211053 [Lactarius pseudohatsudake]|nr:hypothetical protein EDB85DRAFT_2211053 [Lactarius pseudohatsudake]